MRAAIETGVGLTAAKLMVGKAVAKSDETYIARAQLQNAFKKLSKFLNVTGVEPPSQPELAKSVVNQQREITDLKDNIKDLTGRLDLITTEMGRLRTRSRYGWERSDEEIDEIIKRDKEMFRELAKHGLTRKIEDIRKEQKAN